MTKRRSTRRRGRPGDVERMARMRASKAARRAAGDRSGRVEIVAPRGAQQLDLELVAARRDMLWRQQQEALHDQEARERAGSRAASTSTGAPSAPAVEADLLKRGAPPTALTGGYTHAPLTRPT